MFVQRKHEVVVDGRLLVGSQVRIVELRDLVQVGELTQSTKEVICRNSSLSFEERKPEDLRVLGFEGCANLFSEVVVHNVLKVDLVEVVGPGVQNRETLVFDALVAITSNVFLKELEGGLIRVNGVRQIVRINRLLLVANERAKRLYAR